MAKIKTNILALMGRKQMQENRRINPTVMSREIGLSRATIHKWLNNDLSRFDEDTLLALCKYFNCTIGDLIYIDADESETSSD